MKYNITVREGDSRIGFDYDSDSEITVKQLKEICLKDRTKEEMVVEVLLDGKDPQNENAKISSNAIIACTINPKKSEDIKKDPLKN